MCILDVQWVTLLQSVLILTFSWKKAKIIVHHLCIYQTISAWVWISIYSEVKVRECVWNSTQVQPTKTTSVSETIRKPPLVKAWTALKKIKYGKKRFSIWQMELLHPAMWHHRYIDFARWLHPAGPEMWHVALESWQWIHQVAAPYNVIRGIVMTCHWIRPNVCHIGILHLVSISTTSLQSTCHSAPVSEILFKSDQHRQKKWHHVDFQDGGPQPSWILRKQ